MEITAEEVRAFIKDAEKARESWLVVSDRSLNEIKKRQKNGKIWSTTPNSIRKKAKYPAWYSIFKIRQPLVLSRVGIPIGRDTTESGNDGIGATAALLKERLAKNLAKSFDFFDVLCSCRDDFLITCFGQARAYYSCEYIKEKQKEYITPQKTDNGDVVFFNSKGKQVFTDEISQDDMGFFIELEKAIDIEVESVSLEHVLYKYILVDPDIRKWNKRKRLAFIEFYSEPEFKEIFGVKAFLDLASPETKGGVDASSHKRQNIKVYEYWDDYQKEVFWLAEHGSDFIKPKGYLIPDNEEALENEYTNGLYNLERFFPCPTPLLSNTVNDEFWPIPEYLQLADTFEDIHNIFSRMYTLTRAIRVRLLFDNNVEGLQAALSEAAEADAIGIPNLAAALTGAGGSLENVVQYIPVTELINGLAQMYQALEQRLNTIYKLSGTSDLLQGLVTDPTQRTFGERQMTEKYALNQLAEPQRKMAEFVRDCYELLTEMALKNFKDESLDKYIIPQTLEPVHQSRYKAALGLLKDDQKRFRIELETDSTIALNEQYDKQMRIELVNAMTQALEKVAGVAQQQPELLALELHALKFLVQGFRQAKLFQDEITQSIDNVIKQAQQPKPPEFNVDQATLEFKKEELQVKTQLEQARMQSDQQLKQMELQQSAQVQVAQNQIGVMKIQSDSSEANAMMQLEYQKLAAQINEAQMGLQLKKDELQIELKKITDVQQERMFKLQMNKQLMDYEAQLSAAKHQLESYRVQMDEKEKYMTEARLQAEHDMEKVRFHLEQMTAIRDMQAQQQPVINVHVPEQKPLKVSRKVKHTRDSEGNIIESEIQDSHDLMVP